MMKTPAIELTDASPESYFEAMLAISTIHFKCIAEVTETAQTTAREIVGECLSAAKASVVAASSLDVAAIQVSLAQRMLSKIAAASEQYWQVVLRNGQEVPNVLTTQVPTPFLPMLMSTGRASAMDMFSRDIGRLETAGAANLGVAVDALSRIGEEMTAQIRKAASTMSQRRPDGAMRVGAVDRTARI